MALGDTQWHMRAGNGKGLQPIIRERFSRPHTQDGFGATRIHTNRGHSGLGPDKCQSLQTGGSGVLRACVPLPWSLPFPWSRPPLFPCSHVPMFDMGHAATTQLRVWQAGVQIDELVGGGGSARPWRRQRAVIEGAALRTCLQPSDFLLACGAQPSALGLFWELPPRGPPVPMPISHITYNITCTPISHHSAIQHPRDSPGRAPLGYRSKPMLAPDFRFWCLQWLRLPSWWHLAMGH
jgi:hypothetical protein